MCGIFGAHLTRPLAQADIVLARTACAALAHRGPDASGDHLDADNGLFLGHRRLKIVDLSEAAAQPMVRGACVLSYNGELYNYQELRRDLEGLGARFSSDSDTEVLLQAWMHWGEGALDRFDGMFAFALWDGEALHLATDPFGEKPLYIAERDDGVWFSSELPPLVSALSLTPEIGADTMASFMALGFIPDPRTAYPGVSRLSPATVLTVRRGKRVASRRYWTAPVLEARGGPVEALNDAALDGIADILLESLRGRLIADVPLCLLLSNGVDSTLIAAMAAKELKRDLTCLTVNFSGDDRNESEAAERVARTLGLEHMTVRGDDDPEIVTPDMLFERFGQPNDNVAMSSLEQVAAGARGAGFVVGITGFGGDEAFLGYLKHQLVWKRRAIFAMPECARLAIGAVAGPMSGLDQRARIFRNLFAVTDSTRYLALKNQPAIHALLEVPGVRDWAGRLFANWGRMETAVPMFDRDCVMPSSQLTSSDLGAMRRGVELRTPFLSRRLFEYLGQFDPRAFLAFGQKSATRALLSRYLPSQPVLKGKRGFLFPMGRLIDRRRCDPPVVDGIPVTLVRRIFQREDAGHMRLALRLLILERFPHWHAARIRAAAL